jgi:serine/threonine protein kinase
LVHRDVKPDNILVGINGVHKLADLGIATPIGQDGKAIQDRPFGSAHYCAPEQASGQAIDVRADIYALGATVFHLLTGRTMYSGSSVELVRQHLTAPIPEVAALVPGLDEEMVALLTRMLHKAPDVRPASAREVASISRDILDRLQGLMPRSSSRVPAVVEEVTSGESGTRRIAGRRRSRSGRSRRVSSRRRRR